MENDIEIRRDELRKQASTYGYFRTGTIESKNQQLSFQRDLLRDRQRETLQSLDYSKRNMQSELQGIRMENSELDQIKQEQLKEIKYLRDENRKL